MTRWRTLLRPPVEADRPRPAGTQPIGGLTPRSRARIAGRVVSITYQPKGAPPAFVARVSDGTGTIGLVFLGRVEVPGIVAGRHLVATGTVGNSSGLPIMYNPSYELLPR